MKVHMITFLCNISNIIIATIYTQPYLYTIKSGLILLSFMAS